MGNKPVDIPKVLGDCERVIQSMDLVIKYTASLDPFFKGDLDGKTIYIGAHLSDAEKLFNLLHLAGHSIQWNTDEFLRQLGSVLYNNPDDATLVRLQTYEWQANCYALSILHLAGEFRLDKWLRRKYVQDMLYLTNYYKTGMKSRHVSKIALQYPFKRELEERIIPVFTPKASTMTRNGLVVAF